MLPLEVISLICDCNPQGDMMKCLKSDLVAVCNLGYIPFAIEGELYNDQELQTPL